MDNNKTITLDFLFRTQRWKLDASRVPKNENKQNKAGIDGTPEFLFLRCFSVILNAWEMYLHFSGLRIQI